MANPDFLVIGAQKAGTTWLYENLQRHPDVWLPPVKEIHYFDRLKLPLFLDMARRKYARGMLWRWLKPSMRNAVQDPRNIPWHARFFLLPRSDQWYAKCFHAPHGALAGDITPGYARLPDQTIAQAARLLPEARVIYILRDPIERLWSQAAMYFSRYRHGGLDNQSAATIAEFVMSQRARINSDYCTNLDRWLRHFPQNQVHIAFFDRIESDPHGFLTDICDFLQIAPPALETVVTEKIHTRSYPDIPSDLLSKLRVAYLPELEALHDRFENAHTALWLQRAKSIE